MRRIILLALLISNVLNLAGCGPVEKLEQLEKEVEQKETEQAFDGLTYLLLLNQTNDKVSETVDRYARTANAHVEGEANAETLNNEARIAKQEIQATITELEEIAPRLPEKYKRLTEIFIQSYKELPSVIDLINEGVLTQNPDLLRQSIERVEEMQDKLDEEFDKLE